MILAILEICTYNALLDGMLSQNIYIYKMIISIIGMSLSSVSYVSDFTLKSFTNESILTQKKERDFLLILNVTFNSWCLKRMWFTKISKSQKI